MRTKIKVLQLKILLVILEILLVLLIWTLVQLFLNKGEVAESFKAESQIQMSDNAIEESDLISPLPQNTEIPFVLTNFDKIRVVITNKETGGIYHESAEKWKDRADYRGTLEIMEEAEGFVVINELPIEEYLYSVVPSEMPASYPLEALKAQAICARTYAYLHVLSPGYPEWNAHVDDTTTYQVYHSIDEQESTTRAVNETEGMVLCDPSGEALAQTYYYSTSCGYGSDAHVWRTQYADCYPYIVSRAISRDEQAPETLNEEEFLNFIKSRNPKDFEVNEEWYRWTYQVANLDEKHMLKVLQERYEANKDLILTQKGDDFVSQPIKKLGKIQDIQIVKREVGGVADELLIITNKQVYKVITELNIRYVLNDGCTKVVRQDGYSVEMNQLLPSAFISLEPEKENGVVCGYKVWGGGYGHGAGMSQNAAKAMANDGMNASQILEFFYADCFIKEMERTQG